MAYNLRFKHDDGSVIEHEFVAHHFVEESATGPVLAGELKGGGSFTHPDPASVTTVEEDGVGVIYRRK